MEQPERLECVGRPVRPCTGALGPLGRVVALELYSPHQRGGNFTQQTGKPGGGRDTSVVHLDLSI